MWTTKTRSTSQVTMSPCSLGQDTFECPDRNYQDLTANNKRFELLLRRRTNAYIDSRQNDCGAKTQCTKRKTSDAGKVMVSQMNSARMTHHVVTTAIESWSTVSNTSTSFILRTSSSRWTALIFGRIQLRHQIRKRLKDFSCSDTCRIALHCERHYHDPYGRPKYKF